MRDAASVEVAGPYPSHFVEPDFGRRKWQLTLRPASTLMFCPDTEFVCAADWAKYTRIFLILELPFASPAAFPGTGNNKLDSKLAEHLGQPRPGCTVAVSLDALRIVA
ncbi:MAG TPA: hypothetical protein VI685_18770 [Candidatus Angelobacter sp.]